MREKETDTENLAPLTFLSAPKGAGVSTKSQAMINVHTWLWGFV